MTLCFLRVDGSVLNGFEPHPESNFHIESDPVTEWWIHVAEFGRWLLVDSSTVKRVEP
jgi:hypothetical protein